MHDLPMLNCYPDSLDGHLSGTADFLARPEVRGAFGSLYVLPTVYHTDLDRGFSVISYDLCRDLASPEDLERIRALGIDLTLDLILNHMSVLSPQFQDMLHRKDSPYLDFFIDWNRFWEGCGRIEEDGVLHPDPAYLKEMSLRKPGLPVLSVRLPDGWDHPYWNTFYQKVTWPVPDETDLMQALSVQYHTAQRLAKCIRGALSSGLTPRQMDLSAFGETGEAAREWLLAHRRYLGQMDLNVASPLVWEFYRQTIRKLAGYGASTLRLDAFTRLHKAPGRANFMNEPETWKILERLRGLAAESGMEVLPEIHETYQKGTFRKLAQRNCIVYDYFLPGLILDALETGDPGILLRWGREIRENGLRTVSMLGCHDGIPIKDLWGILPEERRQALIRLVTERGGIPKMIHGAVEEVYQMSCTYFSALGADERKLLLARALQVFMPGKPQVWYLDLLAQVNDDTPLRTNPQEDSREINRACLSADQIQEALKKPVVQEQLSLLRLRSTCPAFQEGAEWSASADADGNLTIIWQLGQAQACLRANLRTYAMQIHYCG